MASDEPGAAAPRDHFSGLVRQWSHFGPPLRPSPDDAAVVQRVVAGLGAARRVVVLGLTPEIIGCTWPDGTDLTAVDHSPAMVRALWPPVKGPPDARVVLADWRAMPLASGTIDLVVGDGCYIVLTYPGGFEALTREVRRVLRCSGQFVIRVFLRPDRPESVADIARAVALGEVGSVHALKLRLQAALHDASGPGTRLDDVWRAWKTLPPPPAALAGTRGWTVEEIGGIEAYRGMGARYFLPTLAEFRQIVSSAFVEVECAWNHQELGDRCPTLVLAPKATPCRQQ
jgi:SAM-dependent methyltransferase